MKNSEAVDRIEQAHSALIDKLYWVAGSMENSEFKDFIEGIDDKDFKKLFPAIAESKHFDSYRNGDEPMQVFCDFDKFGFIAEIHIPKSDGFMFKDGKDTPVAWSVHGGISRVMYVYSEATDGLIEEIERVADECFNDDLKKFLSKKKKTAA